MNTWIHSRDTTERILQAEEQILERAAEEPNIITRRLAAEGRDSQPADFPRRVMHGL